MSHDYSYGSFFNFFPPNLFFFFNLKRVIFEPVSLSWFPQPHQKWLYLLGTLCVVYHTWSDCYQLCLMSVYTAECQRRRESNTTVGIDHFLNGGQAKCDSSLIVNITALWINVYIYMLLLKLLPFLPQKHFFSLGKSDKVCIQFVCSRRVLTTSLWQLVRKLQKTLL